MEVGDCTKHKVKPIKLVRKKKYNMDILVIKLEKRELLTFEIDEIDKDGQSKMQ